MNKLLASIFVAAPVLMGAALPAQADPRDRGWHPDDRHMVVRPAYPHHDGHWEHGWHDGRYGWWLLAGGLWTFYDDVLAQRRPPTTVIVQSAPPPVVVQPAPVSVPPITQSAPPAATQNWYYCPSSQSYYPYTQACPGGWQIVPATPPDLQR